MDLLTVVIIASIIAIVCFFVGRKFGSNSTSNNFESSNPVTLDRVSEDTEKKLKSKEIGVITTYMSDYIFPYIIAP